MKDYLEKELLYYAAVESSDDSISTTTLNGIITSWNPAAEKFYGYTEKEAIGQNIAIIVPEYLRDEVFSIIEKIRNGERVEHHETVRMHKSGKLINISLTVSPVISIAGEIIGASAIARRISEKELLFNAAVQSSDDAILTKTLDGIITSWNAAAERIYGYTEKEAVGQSLEIIVPENLRSEVHSILERIKKGGRVEHYETVRMHKSGRLINISLTVSPVILASGAIIGASAIAHDITESKQIEEQLRRSGTLPQMVNSSSPEILWITDPQGNSLEFLPEQFNFTGKTFEQRENGFYKAVHPDDHEVIKKLRESVIKTQKSSEIEYRFWGENGEWRLASMLAVPLTDRQRNIHGWLGIKMDITRQKKLMTLTISQLHKSFQQLRHLATHMNYTVETERRRIAIEVHDQLGGNLVEIKHQLEHLTEELNKRSGAVELFEIQKNLDHTRELVTETIKIIKKISTELHPAELDYLGLVPAIKNEANNFCNRSGIACELELEIEKTSLDKEQELAIFRIFQELLRNIRRHAQATRMIIRLVENKDEFQMTIVDDGRGITEKEKRAENSLGLLGINERIRQVGGNFVIRGVENVGTTAQITIPLKGPNRTKDEVEVNEKDFEH